jgi:hypothetical protein
MREKLAKHVEPLSGEVSGRGNHLRGINGGELQGDEAFFAIAAENELPIIEANEGAEGDSVPSERRGLELVPAESWVEQNPAPRAPLTVTQRENAARRRLKKLGYTLQKVRDYRDVKAPSYRLYIVKKQGYPIPDQGKGLGIDKVESLLAKLCAQDWNM